MFIFENTCTVFEHFEFHELWKVEAAFKVAYPASYRSIITIRIGVDEESIAIGIDEQS